MSEETNTPSPETHLHREADFWTTHNNFENGSMCGLGLVSDKGKDCWDFAQQEWLKADVPVFRSPAPQTNVEGKDGWQITSIDILREWFGGERYAKEAENISDAVLAWLVKYDLADAGREYFAADVMAIMDDLVPSPETHLPCDAPVLFGLEAQGHIPAVEAALSEGVEWQEIGRRIGWDGETAKQYYERHLARKAAMEGKP